MKSNVWLLTQFPTCNLNDGDVTTQVEKCDSTVLVISMVAEGRMVFSNVVCYPVRVDCYWSLILSDTVILLIHPSAF